MFPKTNKLLDTNCFTRNYICFLSFIWHQPRGVAKGEREQKCAHASLQTTSYTSLMSLPNFTINTKVPTFASYRDTFSKHIDQILQQQQHQLNDNM